MDAISVSILWFIFILFLTEEIKFAKTNNSRVETLDRDSSIDDR